MRCEKKIKNGKLIRCKMEYDGEKIKKIQITGDFFMHPEESIEELENAVKNLVLSEEVIYKSISNFFKSKKVTLIGASPSDFISLIL